MEKKTRDKVREFNQATSRIIKLFQNIQTDSKDLQDYKTNLFCELFYKLMQTDEETTLKTVRFDLTDCLQRMIAAFFSLATPDHNKKYVFLNLLSRKGNSFFQYHRASNVGAMPVFTNFVIVNEVELRIKNLTRGWSYEDRVELFRLIINGGFFPINDKELYFNRLANALEVKAEEQRQVFSTTTSPFIMSAASLVTFRSSEMISNDDASKRQRTNPLYYN